MASIASSATSVLIAHVAAHTYTIRLGVGRRHAAQPLAAHHRRAVRHPRRPCTRAASTSASAALRAATRTPCGRCDGRHTSSDTFPNDVLELQGYLSGESRIPGVQAVPGAGTNVPLYILGSSLFGAKLAAALRPAVRLRLPLRARRAAGRRRHLPPRVPTVRPARRAPRDRRRERDRRRHRGRRRRTASPRSADAAAVFFVGGGRSYTDDEADQLLDSPQGRQISRMMRYSAIGTPGAVRDYLDDSPSTPTPTSSSSPTPPPPPRTSCARSTSSPTSPASSPPERAGVLQTCLS